MAPSGAAFFVDSLLFGVSNVENVAENTISIGIPVDQHLGYIEQQQLIAAAADRLHVFSPVTTPDGLGLSISLQAGAVMEEVVVSIRSLLAGEKPLNVRITTAAKGLGAMVRRKRAGAEEQ